jgi:hypothetical protein
MCFLAVRKLKEKTKVNSFFKKNIEIMIYWIDSGQFGFTHQTLSLGRELHWFFFFNFLKTIFYLTI